tara:strand:- start:3127 stop:3426 length:300 start_codon:yes stop_codon:yes gene_type:complete
MEKEIYTTKKAKQLLRKKNTIVITDIDHGGTWVILQKDDFIHSVLNKGHYFVNYDGEQQSVTYSHHEGYKPTLSIHAPCCVSDNPKIMIGEDEIFEDLE